MRRCLFAVFGGVLLAAGLAGGVTSAAWADAPTASAQQGGIHAVYCQTPQYDSYAKFWLYGSTPGGGPLCYTGTGTTTVNLHDVTRFEAGAHAGNFSYRSPGQPVAHAVFRAGQVVVFALPSDVLSLTLIS